MKKISVSRLENGLQVVSEQIPQVESVALGVWIRAGLEVEPDKLLGISHYLEHMLFKGTGRRTAKQISHEIDNVGGHLNGYTDREYTSLFVHLLGEHLPLAVDMIFDMALNSLLSPEDVEREREVIIQESRRLEDNPEEQVHDLAVETAWEGHSLSRFPQGTENSINAIKPGDLATYFRSYYRPNRMLVAAAGAVEHEKFVELLEKALGSAAPGVAETQGEPPVFHAKVKRISRDTEQVHITFALPGCAQMDKKRYCLALLDTLLGGSTSSHLFQEIRENSGLVYAISSYTLSCRNAGLFLINAGTGADNIEQVLDLIQSELKKFRKEGVAEADLAWAKSYIRGSLALARESTAYRMQRLAYSSLYEGRVVGYRELLRRFEEVTAQEIQTMAERLFSVEPTLVTIGP